MVRRFQRQVNNRNLKNYSRFVYVEDIYCEIHSIYIYSFLRNIAEYWSIAQIYILNQNQFNKGVEIHIVDQVSCNIVRQQSNY